MKRAWYSIVCLFSTGTVTHGFLTNNIDHGKGSSSAISLKASASDDRRRRLLAGSQESSRLESHKNKSLPSQLEFVDFWGSKVQIGHGDDHNRNKELPADHTLDRDDGQLPAGVYLLNGANEKMDTKLKCRISLSIDWNQKSSRFRRFPMETNEVVRKVQECVDSGFQTFELSSECNNPDMIGSILRETPKFIEMCWMVTLELPSQVSRVTIREAVFALLLKTQTEALDILMIPFNEKILPQYYLDALDTIQDLQRDGYVRAVGAKEWPENLLADAKKNGFVVDIQQQSGNLLLPPSFSGSIINEVSSWWTNPLVNNLLTDYSLERREPPTRINGWSDVLKWYNFKQRNIDRSRAKRSATDTQIWKSFQKDVLETLRNISRKHEVSMKTIVLRWSLQEKVETKNNYVANTVTYPLFLVEEPEDHLRREIRQLRDVFRFELDEEDLEALGSIIVKPKKSRTSLKIDDIDVPIDDIPLAFLKEFEAMKPINMDEDQEDGYAQEEYPVIDFNNPTLWL